MRTYLFSSVLVVALVLSARPVSAGEAPVENIMADLSSGAVSSASAGKTAPAVAEDTVAAPAAAPQEDTGVSKGILGSYLKDVSVELARRDAEESAINAVRESWNGTVLRDYRLSADAKRALGLLDADQVMDVRGKFPEVSFGDVKTYALYRPQLNRLFVMNTPEQISKLEAVLASLEKFPEAGFDQVEIEARFVEFEEGALDGLGFGWSNPSALENGKWILDANATLLNSGRTLPGAGVLDVSGKVGSANLDLAIHALDQTDGVDMLSAPRIVTVSGKKAVIQVGQRHYFPQIYEEGVSEGTVLHVRYEDFEEKLLGVEMAVTPKIKGSEILLEMNPKVIDLIGWEKFELAPPDSSYTYYQYRVGMQFEHESVVAQLPVFKEREIKTTVTIRDGATVGMGGLISEKTEAFEDRVPVLGSIPLIGRLFRSEGERSVKRNLMIFVTAKKVQPNGTVLPGQQF